MNNLKFLFMEAITIYAYIIVARAILSWVHINPYGNFFKIYLILIKVTEPVLEKIRELQHRIFPNSPIDFSPIIAILLLNFIRNLIYGSTKC